MSEQKRSRFKVRASHLLPPQPWTEAPPPARRWQPSLPSGPPQPQPQPQPHLYYQNCFTNNYRSVTRTPCHTFYEDYCTFKVNHFTVDQASGGILNHFSAKASPNHSKDFACLHPDSQNRNFLIGVSERKGDAEPETTDWDKKSGSDAGNGRNLSMNSDHDGHNCNTDGVLEEDEEEDFSFSTASAADSTEFFQFMTASSSPLCQIQAWHSASVMTSADELFEDGKIRPLLPAFIGVDERISSDSTGAMEKSRSPAGMDRIRKSCAGYGDFTGSRRLGRVRDTEINFNRTGALRKTSSAEGETHKKTAEAAPGSLIILQDCGRREKIAAKRRTTLQDCLEHQEKIASQKSHERLKATASDSSIHAASAQKAARRGQSAASSPLRKPPQRWPAKEASATKKVKPLSAPMLHSAFQKAQTAKTKTKTKTFAHFRHRLLRCLGYKNPH